MFDDSVVKALKTDVETLKTDSAKHGADLSYLQQFQDDFDGNVKAKLDPVAETLREEIQALRKEQDALQAQIETLRGDFVQMIEQAKSAAVADAVQTSADAAQAAVQSLHATINSRHMTRVLELKGGAEAEEQTVDISNMNLGHAPVAIAQVVNGSNAYDALVRYDFDNSTSTHLKLQFRRTGNLAPGLIRVNLSVYPRS